MEATILFPGDYFSMNDPSGNFAAEFEAAGSFDSIKTALFNFDGYITGDGLVINEPIERLPKDLIYRGWMLKPKQYERFYSDLKRLGFDPIVEPEDYRKAHLFPEAASDLVGYTPKFLAFPAQDDSVHIDVNRVNPLFDRIMFKDYVKSLKQTDFPAFVEMPITQERMDALASEFIARRGELFTDGIVLKEYVDLKLYEGKTNEWRQFIFSQDTSMGSFKNSCQTADVSRPPEEFLDSLPRIDIPFYTLDVAELSDGTWTIIEIGEGQVSGLAEADDPIRFYGELARIIEQSERS